MAITETIKNLLGKVLSIGTPPEKEVLYKEVIKRKAPKESAEKLMINDFKNSVKKVFAVPEDVEFARGTPNPPVKKAAKKKKTAKKPTSKKSTSTTKNTTTTTKKKTPTKTKATESKSTTTKKAPVKKTASTKTVTKKTADKKHLAKKTTEKKVATKKATTTKKPPTQTTDVKKTTAKKTVSKKATETTKKKTPSTTKPTEKKVSNKKVNTKVATEKKAATKKTTSKKKVTTTTKKITSTKKSSSSEKGSKRDEKIALYIKDIQKHYGEVDEAFVAIIVKNLGPSIYRRDAELVSCSDPKELDTVRRNFLMKKLGIDASQAVLDAAIQDVCTELKGVRTKYRATFYYSLAKKFKKESVLS